MKKSKTQGQLTGLLSPLIEKVRLTKVIREVRGKQILDVGCGTGRLQGLLPKNVNYIGIEKNKNYVKIAKKLYPDATVLIFDIEREEFKNINKKFDSIILAALLEHLRNPLRIVVKLTNLLQPKGLIIITTPTRLGFRLHKYLSKIKLTSPEGAKEHTRPLEKEDFVKIEKASALKLIKYEKFTFGLNQLLVFKKV